MPSELDQLRQAHSPGLQPVGAVGRDRRAGFPVPSRYEDREQSLRPREPDGDCSLGIPLQGRKANVPSQPILYLRPRQPNRPDRALPAALQRDDGLEPGLHRDRCSSPWIAWSTGRRVKLYQSPIYRVQFYTEPFIIDSIIAGYEQASQYTSGRQSTTSSRPVVKAGFNHGHRLRLAEDQRRLGRDRVVRGPIIGDRAGQDRQRGSRVWPRTRPTP